MAVKYVRCIRRVVKIATISFVVSETARFQADRLVWYFVLISFITSLSRKFKLGEYRTKLSGTLCAILYYCKEKHRWVNTAKIFAQNRAIAMNGRLLP